MPHHAQPPISSVVGRSLAALVGILLMALPAGLATPASADPGDDPLQQTLDDLPIVHGDQVLDAGHVDMGPKFDGDTWRFLIHDDAARADATAQSVWRYPEETVFHVLDQGRLELPDDPAYAFTGASAGDPVWVVPQTQNPEVVWLGWNTQDPRVMQTIDRGVTMTLTGVQGPGIATVYLQSGSFGEPQVLWDSRRSEEQPVFVDVNTHTHANWVFTQPGTYLMRLKVEADLIDGSHASDTQLLRFAVGTATPPEQAFAATWEGLEPADDGDVTGSTSADGPAADQSSDSVLVPVLVGAIIAVALALIVGFGIAIARSSRARKQVLGSTRPDGEQSSLQDREVAP